MDFGDLRAAVQVARGQPRKVGDVVWCVLKSERREEALHYAVDSLSSIVTSGTVNLGELVAFVVEGEPALKKGIAEPNKCSEDLLYEFLAAWAFSVVHRKDSTPALTIDGSSLATDRWYMVQSWESGYHHDWVIQFPTYEGYEVDAPIVAHSVDWSVWNSNGISPHLRTKET